jgi:hypothetical protein
MITGKSMRNSHRQAGTKRTQASRCENPTGKPVQKSHRQAGAKQSRYDTYTGKPAVAVVAV